MQRSGTEQTVSSPLLNALVSYNFSHELKLFFFALRLKYKAIIKPNNKPAKTLVESAIKTGALENCQVVNHIHNPQAVPNQADVKIKLCKKE